MPCLWSGFRVREEEYKVLLNSSKCSLRVTFTLGGDCALCNLLLQVNAKLQTHLLEGV